MKVSSVKFLLLAISATAICSAFADDDTTNETTTYTYSGDDDLSALFTTVEVQPGLSDYNPDLQKLRDFRSVLRANDKYFHTVGWIYRNSGFRALGDALEFSGPIVHRLADPTSRVIPRKQAVRAVRRIQVALRDTPRYMPKFSKSHPYDPVYSGDALAYTTTNSKVSYPNYTGLAFRYLSNLQRALYNRIKGRRITKDIPAPKKELWIRVDPFKTTYQVNGALFQNGTIYTAYGAYNYSASFLDATNVYSGASGVLAITAVGPTTLTLSGSNFQKTRTSGRHWVAFSSGAFVPYELTLHTATILILGVPYTVNGVPLQTGAWLLQMDDGALTPEGAISLDGADLVAVPTPID